MEEGAETRAPLHNHPMIHPTQQIAPTAEQENPLARLVFVCDHLRRDPSGVKR
jgi:hypothetical protein